jgi:hypothetical protein
MGTECVALYVVIIQSLGTIRYITTLQRSANVVEGEKYYRQKCIARKYIYSNIPMWLSSVLTEIHINSDIITHIEQNCRSQILKRKSKKRHSSDISSTPVRSRPKNHLNLHVHPFHPQNIHFRVVVHFPREKTESRTTFNLSISLHELHLSTVVSESPTYLEFLIQKVPEKISPQLKLPNPET